MNGSHPRLSRTGRVVSGFGDVWCGGQNILPGGLLPQWLDEDTIAAIDRHDHLVACDPTGGHLRPLHVTSPVTRFGAGAGIFRIPRAGEIWVTVDPVTGAVGTVIEHKHPGDPQLENNDRSIVIDGIVRLDHVPVNNLRLFNGAAVWQQWPGHGANLSWTAGIRDYRESSTVEDLRSLEHDWEGDPVPFDVAGEPWFAFITNTDIRCRPWASYAGYILETGEDENKNVDAVGLPGLSSPIIRLAWNTTRGELVPRDLFLDLERRTDVRRPQTYRPVVSTPEPPDPPDPPDPPEPPPVEEETRMIAYAPPVPGFLPGELEPHPDGNGLVAVRLPSGKVLCCTPDGVLETRDSAGPWEAFRKSGASLVAERGDKVHVLPFAG